MKKSIKYLIVAIVLIINVLATLFSLRYFRNKSKNVTQTSAPITTSNNIVPVNNNPVSNVETLAYPIADFSSRITKKPFGIYITPSTSPVQSERFTGYHTGADVEYEDVTTDVPVFAVANGTVIESRIVSGYGGVFIIKADYNGATYTFLYGHIRPSSLPNIGQQVKKGEQLAVLGTGYSSETDGERRHLHFAVTSSDSVELRGYVQNKSDLDLWLNPQDLKYQ